MLKNFSFLITYYDQEDQLRACIKSIKKFYPDNPIILSQEICEIPVDIPVTKHIFHDMRRGVWADACQGLMNECPTDIGVFIEHDCVLLKPIDDLIEKLEDFDLVGVEEVLPNGMRWSPGFANQNFFILNVSEFIKKHGVKGIRVMPTKELKGLKNVEAAYGITQNSKEIYFIPTKMSGYGTGTYYGDYVHHMWFGSYRQRLVENDDIDRRWLDDEVYRFLKDYENSCLINLPE